LPVRTVAAGVQWQAPTPVRTETERARGIVIRDLADMGAIEAEWDGTVAAGPWNSPIQENLWARTYLEVFAASGRLFVVDARSASSYAIAPLFRPRGWFRSLELIGVEELFEVTDFVYAGSTALVPLADTLVRACRPIVLRRIPAGSAALAALRRACSRDWITFCRPSRGCPYIVLDETWLQPETHINAGRRSDLRRARRTAEKMAPLSCEIITPTPDQVPELLQQAYLVEAGSWKGREGTALQFDIRLGEFYRRYAIAASERGTLRVCFLRIGDEVAAMQIGVVHGNRFWLLKVGYLEKYARCSPGVLLMVETISYAARSGLQSYEFLGASESWIRTWTQLEHPCVSFRAYPLTPFGLAAFTKDAICSARRDSGSPRRS
jgi:CelD/BcsL family acetyltransferase involved in cellulose biosynthesis